MVNNYEERYWELREEVDRTFDRYCATREDADYDSYFLAEQTFFGYCADVLAVLMEENVDVLKRLKGE